MRIHPYSRHETRKGVYMGSDMRAIEEPPSTKTSRGRFLRFEVVEARNGMPEVLPYSYRACWDTSRRARLTAAILADIEAERCPS